MAGLAGAELAGTELVGGPKLGVETGLDAGTDPKVAGVFANTLPACLALARLLAPPLQLCVCVLAVASGSTSSTVTELSTPLAATQPSTPLPTTQPMTPPEAPAQVQVVTSDKYVAQLVCFVCKDNPPTHVLSRCGDNASLPIVSHKEFRCWCEGFVIPIPGLKDFDYVRQR